MSKFKLFIIVISFISLVIINYDYFYTKEFHIERGYCFGLSLLMILSILRHFIKSISFKNWSTILLNGIIITIILFNFYMLAIFSLGYGFTGKPTHFIWYISTLINTLLFFIILIESIQLLIKILTKNKSND